MAGLPRSAIGVPSRKQSMRPPPRPNAPTPTGRSPSPATSVMSNTNKSRPKSPSVLSNAGAKRKERDFESDGTQETNIHVVVRCRGRNEREVRENSGVVVSTDGAKGRTVELSMGPNALSNKTYHFDKVFSPAADQTIIFDDVVMPFLSEMLQGYNCTIFAYGQTGTGKTYTMSGDMTDTLGILSDAAGIIPRVLYSLFQKLEQDGTESSVKCSFIELYNEELRDLISPEENAKLKIFEDQNKKGSNATQVQGMEESHIKSAGDGIKLLKEGSHRRQVAATKCNDLSSRSHTVFTITVYTKRTTDTGEDFVSVGKLNLVDLAGSENIQRSGAENKRAAEAGLINKSLLTLGRVINALVDKSSHIPYRESKLTRLLQDSLGGRTKTCIIATVSPAKSNIEETISTLNYAFHAKNIRNKPQINSTISKKTLLREFTTEIEKLKSELLATRQRNGVYLTNVQFEEITSESESRRILSEEQRDRIETIEVSLRNKVQELFSLTSNFNSLKKDNETIKTTLDSTQDILQKTESVLNFTEQNLAEEIFIQKAHQLTEDQLYGTGTGLISKMDETVADISALHEKLRRRSNLHDFNRGTWEASVAKMSDIATVVEDKVAEFQEAQTESIASIAERIEGFVRKEVDEVNESKSFLEGKTSAFEEAQKEVNEQTSKAHEEMNEVLEEIKILREDVKGKVGDGLKGLSAAAGRISEEVITELDQFHEQLFLSFQSLGKEFRGMFELLIKQIDKQRKEVETLKEQLQEADAKIIAANQNASSLLEKTLQEERRAAEVDRTVLFGNIKALISASAEGQDARLTSKINTLRCDLDQSNKTFEEAGAAYASSMNEWGRKENELLLEVGNKKDGLKNKLTEDWENARSRNEAIQTTTKSVHEETVRIVDVQMEAMATQMAALDDFVTRARCQNGLHHESHIFSLQTLGNSVRESYSSIADHFTGTSGRLQTFGVDLSNQTSELQSSITPLDTTVRQPLVDLRTVIQAAPFTEYTVTGQTPQKTAYEYPKSLPRTQPREKLLSKLKRSYDTANGNDDSTSGRSPTKSPQKSRSPTKALVYTDDLDTIPRSTISTSSATPLPDIVRPATALGLREVDVNVFAPNINPLAVSMNASGEKDGNGAGAGQPPLKRHATASAVELGGSKLPLKLSASVNGSGRPGRENQPAGLGFSSSVGVGGRRVK